jgi:hypothetical protein
MNRDCGFESHGFRLAHAKRLHSPVVQRQRLLAYTQATMVQVHPGLLDHKSHSRPRGAARSARQPVTLEIVGSNPIEDAFPLGTVRKLAKRRSSNLRDLRVRLPPVPLENQSLDKSGRVPRGGL